MKKLFLSMASLVFGLTSAMAGTWVLAGEYQGWNLDNNHFTQDADGKLTLTVGDLSGEFKVIYYKDSSTGNDRWNDGQWGNNTAITPNVANTLTYVPGGDGGNSTLSGGVNQHLLNAKVTITPSDLENPGPSTTVEILIESDQQEEYHYDPNNTWVLTGTYQNWKLESNKFYINKDGVLEQKIPDLYGDFKVVYNRGDETEWTYQWGTNGTPIKEGEPYKMAFNGDNALLAGNSPHYTNAVVTLVPEYPNNPTQSTYVTLTITAESVTDAGETWQLVGPMLPLTEDFTTAPKFEKVSDSLWTLTVNGTVSGDFKVVHNAAWPNQYSTQGIVNENTVYTLSGPQNELNYMTAGGSWSNPTFELTVGDDDSVSLKVTTGTSGLDNVEAADEEVEYYDLTGMKVEKLVKGIYLVKQGKKVSKVIK